MIKHLPQKKMGRDLFITFFVICLSFGAMIYFDAFELLYEFTRRHEDWELDEFVLMFFALPIPLLWFGYRQIRETLRLRDISVELESEIAHVRKIEALGTLAGGVAHELNNQLVPILGVTEVLLDQKRESDPDYKKLQLVMESASNAKVTVEKILKFVRTESNTTDYCHISSVVSELEKIVRVSCPPSINLGLHIDENIGLIRMSRSDLESLIMNLCSNAIDAIEFDTGNIDLEVTSTDSGSNAVIQIRDTGTGMSMDTKERIFDPLFTTKEVGKGTGLGLSMIYSAVQNADGSISVESEVGKGTTIRIQLPVETPDSVSV